MRVSADHVMNGIINYAENEVIENLPTSGKWLMGTGIGIATTKANEVIDALNENKIVRAMGIIDEDGMFDLDLIMDNMRECASKYGKVSFQIPLVGKITFSDQDISSLKSYIERG